VAKWTSPEIRIVKDTWPKYGTQAVARRFAECGYQRTDDVISAYAIHVLGLRRAGFDPEEDRILRQGVEAGLNMSQISQKLAKAGWSRGPKTIGKRARELGIWRPWPTSQAKVREYEDRMRAKLRGGPYRELTDITPWLIRLYHSRGDSAEYLAEDMNRPLWFVQAVIAGEPWQERWRQERIKRGLEEPEELEAGA
jgi:hypothetical protein